MEKIIEMGNFGPRPHICYCQVPEDKLKSFATRRFIDNIPTEVLMCELEDPKDREALAAVALLDVKPEDLPKVIPDNPALLMHLYDCRFHVRAILEEAGILISERTIP